VMVNLGANLIVIPRWGINGAATTSTIGYLIVLTLVLRHYLRTTRSPPGAVLRLKRGDLQALWGPGYGSRSESPTSASMA